MQPTQEKFLSSTDASWRAFGLRKVMLLLTSLVVGIVLLFNGTSFHLLQRHLHDLRLGKGQEQLSISREILEQRLAFYDDLLRSYADSLRVRDMISFDDRTAAMGWSAEVRNALPQAIGAALFTEEGNVLGDPVAQRVGNSCIAYLREQVAGRHEHGTPLHTAVPALAHFDMSAPVRDEAGRITGLVFVSFSIDELQTAVENMATGSTAAALVDKETQNGIAASSNWDNLPDAAQHTSQVENADWLLHMQIQPDTLKTALPALGVTIAVGAGLVILLMLVFHRVLIRNYFGVVEDIRGIIQRIVDGGAVEAQELVDHNRLFPVTRDLREDLAHLRNHYENMQIESRTDGLTGLANRRVFDERLANLLASRRSSGAEAFCVVLLDLDGFKRTNDHHGHGCGDRVLKALASTLRSGTRDSDLASRWGGDEFAVLLPNMSSGQLDEWIDRLRLAFARAQRDIADLPEAAYCGVSRGYSCVGIDDSRNADEVLHEADQSLYSDKQQRRR